MAKVRVEAEIFLPQPSWSSSNSPLCASWGLASLETLTGPSGAPEAEAKSSHQPGDSRRAKSPLCSPARGQRLSRLGWWEGSEEEGGSQMRSSC